jgi:hypothetical protein
MLLPARSNVRHGGLTPAALDNDDRRSRQNRVSLQCDTHTHGGLTPAALVNVRLCIGKIVFSRQTFATQYKSGGRKPPVVSPVQQRRRS